MKVTQEKLPASQVGLEIEITPETSKNTYEQVIQKFARSLHVPGFRKGKVPRHILLQRLGGSRLKAATVEELIQNSLEKVVKDEQIEIIGSFELRSDFDQLVDAFDPGQSLTFSVIVDVHPEVTLGDYQALQVQAEEVPFDPAQVEEVLTKKQAEMATLIPVEGRPAQAGDIVVIDFVGRFPSEGEGTVTVEVPGGSAKDFQLELTEGQFIPGFVEGMMGMSVGETKEILTHFPESYSNDELAGRSAIFSVTLNDIKEKELPELDDDFAQEVSSEETIADLRESLEKRLKAERERETQVNKDSALVEALVAKIEVEIPETMIKQEVDQLMTQNAMELSKYGINIKEFFTKDNIPLIRERFRPDAIERIKAALAIAEVAKRESITVTEEEIRKQVAQLMAQIRDQDVDPLRVWEVVKTDLIKEKTIDWLEEHATIELVPLGTLDPIDDEEEDEEEDEDDAVEAVSAEVVNEEA